MKIGTIVRPVCSSLRGSWKPAFVAATLSISRTLVSGTYRVHKDSHPFMICKRELISTFLTFLFSFLSAVIIPVFSIRINKVWLTFLSAVFGAIIGEGLARIVAYKDLYQRGNST